MTGGEWDDSWLEAAYESSVTGDVDDAPEDDDEEDDMTDAHGWHAIDAVTATELVREVRSENGRITWTPVTDGHGIGYRLTHEDGRTRYLYLYPSTDDGITGGDPGTTFVYEVDAEEIRATGVSTSPVCYLDTFAVEEDA